MEKKIKFNILFIVYKQLKLIDFVLIKVYKYFLVTINNRIVQKELLFVLNEILILNIPTKSKIVL